MKKRYLIAFITTLTLTAITVSAIAYVTPGKAPVLKFSLITHDNTPFTEQDIHGHPALVFFGFTGCSSICPPTLTSMTDALNTLGPDSNKVKALFITVDPANDTPEQMTDYLAHFHPEITGLTGPPERLQETYNNFNIFTQHLTAPENTFNHGGHIYIFDKHGHISAYFTGTTQAEKITEELRRLLKTSKKGQLS